MYRVRLHEFEGPLDLLLFFIRRDELDIHDIPIAQITDEFLGYVRVMEKIDLDGVGDFIYMAAVLINIKVRMLLPSPEVDDEGDPLDPRRELVERLLEYVRFKEAAHRLAQQHEAREQHFVRGAAGRPDAPAVREPDVEGTLFDLIAALGRILTEAPDDEAVHAVRRVEYTVEEQTDVVLTMLRAQTERVPFREIVAHRSKAYVIATFLAVLELVRQRQVDLYVGDVPDEFYLAEADEPDDVPVDEAAPEEAAPEEV